ncbi:hypothetical protein SAMN05192580_1331 [Sphingomonas jatrophae]|uniref:Uncharacterized protein n=1 Tax=Sphingomonas jatrophae TaxID=1166337 RepID=A0A1I6K532_9SPHN|nr:hypothetical protein SAMN05192580_1331 [Sphingomonas jatrophae]
MPEHVRHDEAGEQGAAVRIGDEKEPVRFVDGESLQRQPSRSPYLHSPASLPEVATVIFIGCAPVPTMSATDWKLSAV